MESTLEPQKDFSFHDEGLPETVSESLARLIIAKAKGEEEVWMNSARKIIMELKTRIPDLLRDESLSTRDITQLLSLLGALGTSPTEDNFPKEQALRKQSYSSSRFQDSHHDEGTHTEESSPETQYVRDESRQESSRKTYSNSVDRVGLGRPSSAPTKARQWSSDVRTDYSIVRNKPPTSQLNEESSSLNDDKNNANVLSSRRIAQLSLRLHKDAERRLNERRDMVNSSPGKIMRPQPELSSTTKIMTEDLAPFQERQQTYMLRKMERMRKFEEARQLAESQKEAEIRSTPAISPWAKMLHRSLDDLMVWHERKNESMRIRKAQSVLKEEAENTFSPNINSKSRYLAAARAFKGESRVRTPPRTFASLGSNLYSASASTIGSSRYSIDSDKSSLSSGRKTYKSNPRHGGSKKATVRELGIEKNWYAYEGQ